MGQRRAHSPAAASMSPAAPRGARRPPPALLREVLSADGQRSPPPALIDGPSANRRARGAHGVPAQTARRRRTHFRGNARGRRLPSSAHVQWARGPVPTACGVTNGDAEAGWTGPAASRREARAAPPAWSRPARGARRGRGANAARGGDCLRLARERKVGHGRRSVAAAARLQVSSGPARLPSLPARPGPAPVRSRWPRGAAGGPARLCSCGGGPRTPAAPGPGLQRPVRGRGRLFRAVAADAAPASGGRCPGGAARLRAQYRESPEVGNDNSRVAGGGCGSAGPAGRPSGQRAGGSRPWSAASRAWRGAGTLMARGICLCLKNCDRL